MGTFCKDSVGKVIQHDGLAVVLGAILKIDNKQELMIFVTPKIVREGVNVY